MAQLLEIASDGSSGGGWTATLGPFTARVDGVGLNLTGLTCTAQIRGRDQSTYVDTVGDVTLAADQTTNPGEWYLNADSADFDYRYSPYTIRLKVVDGALKVAYFPSAEEPAHIYVGRP